jgi:lipopolysaccharide export system ATP-binding protein
VLEAKKIGKSYEGRKVVEDINFSVKAGEVIGIFGPNGAGKTTCFYMIMGIVRPDFGSVYLDGKDITKLQMYERARLGLGYLPQEPSVFIGLSVGDNIMAVLEVVEPSYLKRVNRLNELLAEFSIIHLRGVESSTLSGGERRRLEIARALAANPRYILLDEPLAGIDPIAVNDVKDLVMQLKNRGIGVLITDHNVRDTLAMVDRGYIISEGHVLVSGTPKEISQNKKAKAVYLGKSFKLD